LDPGFLILGEPDAQNTVCNVIPEVADRLKVVEEPGHGLFLFRRVVCLSDVILNAFDAVLEVTISKLRKLLGWQVGFEIVLHQQVQHSKVGDKKADG
jgi:hypothetical protein